MRGWREERDLIMLWLVSVELLCHGLVVVVQQSCPFTADSACHTRGRAVISRHSAGTNGTFHKFDRFDLVCLKALP
jgi:hypothetical protein